MHKEKQQCKAFELVLGISSVTNCSVFVLMCIHHPSHFFYEQGEHASIRASESFREEVFAQVATACPISVTSARQNNSRRVPLLPQRPFPPCVFPTLCAVRGQRRKPTNKHCQTPTLRPDCE